jgi:hypothetical protein
LFEAAASVLRRLSNLAEGGPSRSFNIAACQPTSAPFNAGDIVRGDPRSRSINVIASADGNFDCGVWDCTAGRFRIQYRSDELVHILEGEVTVHVGDRKHALAAGDVAYFPAGTAAEWDIPVYVRKLWVYRTPSPSRVARLARKVLRALDRVGLHRTPASS